MRRKFLFAAIVIVLLCIPEFVFQLGRVSPGYSYTNKAIIRSESFAEACWSYRDRTPARKFPAQLSDLLSDSPPGAGSYIALHGDDCDDPWGNPYKYALVPDEKGEMVPYVWAERVVDGELRLHGATCKADGTAMGFGWPKGK